MSGLDWAVIALGAAGGGAALVVLSAAASRRRRRRKNRHAQLATESRSQLLERRIEVVAIDDGRSGSKQDPQL